jgi:hypothetical protein
MSLSVMIPKVTTDAVLGSSTLTEADFPAYNAATTYTLGDKVISTTTHRIYQSAVAGNLNKDPTLDANQIADPAGIINWIDTGPTNKWAMFDAVVNTQSIGVGTLTVVLNPGFFNSLYLGGLVGDNVQIVVKDAPGGTIVYDTGVIPLGGALPSDYWEYFFSRLSQQTSVLLPSFIQYSAAEVTITIAATTGVEVRCGIAVVGDLQQIARAMYGGKVTPKTYSYINTDSFGTTTIVRRKATTNMTCSARLDTSQATTVVGILQEVLDVPCVWIYEDTIANFEALTIFGLGSSDVTYLSATTTQLDLTVQGLI